VVNRQDIVKASNSRRAPAATGMYSVAGLQARKANKSMVQLKVAEYNPARVAENSPRAQPNGQPEHVEGAEQEEGSSVDSSSRKKKKMCGKFGGELKCSHECEY
jgi:hypothetical protein